MTEERDLQPRQGVSASGAGTLPTYIDVDDVDRLPPTVWLAVRPPRFGGAVPQVFAQPTHFDVPVVPIYSTEAALREGHGPAGEAVEIRRDELFGILEQAELYLVSLDLFVPQECRASDWDDEEVAWPEAPVEEQTVGEVVWTPWRPGSPDGSVQLELHADNDGQKVLALYTSKEVLQECCGPHQPAVAVRTSEVEEVAGQAGADVVRFNPVLAASARHQRPVPRQGQGRGE